MPSDVRPGGTLELSCTNVRAFHPDDGDSLPSLLVCMKQQQHQLMTQPPPVHQRENSHTIKPYCGVHGERCRDTNKCIYDRNMCIYGSILSPSENQPPRLPSPDPRGEVAACENRARLKQALIDMLY